jgi:hypothetical protein
LVLGETRADCVRRELSEKLLKRTGDCVCRNERTAHGVWPATEFGNLELSRTNTDDLPDEK